MSIGEVLFGRPLRTEEARTEELGVMAGVPVLGLDALASAAYGPEAALTVLLPLGPVAAAHAGPITALITLVLLAVYLSYRQTIAAYPQGGGSFTVAKENLGRLPGLLAATSLSIDYVLNVAVAISAGVGAIVSAVPRLLPHTLPLCLVILALITLVNLRGIRSAGVLFMFPTYLFVVCLGITVVLGLVKMIVTGGHPAPVVAPAHVPATTSVASIWLLARAFASGCTALTGVEAVSNAVPIFRPPAVRVARRTLAVIVFILASLLAGVALLSFGYGITATPPGQPGYQSVLSQLVGAVAGRDVFYFITMGGILMVLALSANTSFADFPRVWRVLALDDFLPAGFAHRGRRLVYSRGILVLALLSGALLVAFGGITDRLIPLFAIGAFGAFTLSQLGMVVHWRRSGHPRARRKMAMNAAGATATATTLIVIAVSKFAEGAWLTLLVVPLILYMFVRIRRYREEIDRQTYDRGPLDALNLPPPIVVVPLGSLDRLGRKALRLGLSLSPDVRAVHVLPDEPDTVDLPRAWPALVEQPAREAGHPAPSLVVLSSAYREFFGPLIDYIRALAAEHPDRHIAVVVAELVQLRWYHFLIPRRSDLLNALLLLRGTPQVVVIKCPWYLR